MNDEGNNQLNKQSKFRFLNPDEKKKLKEINEEILGENKNITFDSNVDLTVQFEKKGYDTQRYNIKKLVNERLDATQVYDVSKVLDREKEFYNNSNEGYSVEPDAPNMIVTEIYRNDAQEKINEPTKNSKLIPESDVEEILKTTTELTQKENELERKEARVDKEIKVEKEVQAKKEQELVLEKDIKDVDVKPSVEKETKKDNEVINQNNNQSTVHPRSQSYNNSAKKKIELPEDKREHAKEFFKDEVIEDEQVDEYSEVKQKAVKIAFYLIIAISIIILIILIKGLFDKIVSDDNEMSDNGIDINSEVIEDTEEIVVEDTTTVGVEPPIDKEVMSDYNAVVEILSSNTSDVVLEVTNDDFQYVKDSNNTDYFNDYVYANIKNAQPEKKEDRLVVLFGKDDNQHFGSLRYLDDVDFFNSILVDYTKNNITTRYKALSYYKTDTLDSRVYSKMSDADIVTFIGEEINKSIHSIRKDVTIETNSKVLTLITFDSNENVYHCLHLINVE